MAANIAYDIDSVSRILEALSIHSDGGVKPSTKAAGESEQVCPDSYLAGLSCSLADEGRQFESLRGLMWPYMITTKLMISEEYGITDAFDDGYSGIGITLNPIGLYANAPLLPFSPMMRRAIDKVS
ncbi:hypothetical protein SUNI508_09148 [Seiridium unicorne]|uniref:Uncharacterized protein n=1 Tax=Seiridium unicorne TaxID=138068 RepID=A0ABR2UR48_9PEZI